MLAFTEESRGGIRKGEQWEYIKLYEKVLQEVHSSDPQERHSTNVVLTNYSCAQQLHEHNERVLSGTCLICWGLNPAAGAGCALGALEGGEWCHFPLRRSGVCLSFCRKAEWWSRICHQMAPSLAFSTTQYLTLTWSPRAYSSSWHLNPDFHIHFCQSCSHWVPIALGKMQLQPMASYSPQGWCPSPQHLQVSSLVRSHSLPLLWCAVAITDSQRWPSEKLTFS